jgi:hypothetical protein
VLVMGLAAFGQGCGLKAFQFLLHARHDIQHYLGMLRFELVAVQDEYSHAPKGFPLFWGVPILLRSRAARSA